MPRSTTVHSTNGLTDRQRRFILAFILTDQARESAITAGCSPKSASAQASQMLRLPKIRDVLAQSRRALMQMAGVNAERTLAEISAVAFSDITTLFKDNNLLPVNEWPEETRRAVAAVDIEERDGVRRTRIKLWDKMKATEQLGRHLELFKDTLNINVNIGLAERLQAARDRLQALPAPTEQPIIDVIPQTADSRMPEKVRRKRQKP